MTFYRLSLSLSCHRVFESGPRPVSSCQADLNPPFESWDSAHRNLRQKSMWKCRKVRRWPLRKCHLGWALSEIEEAALWVLRKLWTEGLASPKALRKGGTQYRGTKLGSVWLSRTPEKKGEDESQGKVQQGPVRVWSCGSLQGVWNLFAEKRKLMRGKEP